MISDATRQLARDLIARGGEVVAPVDVGAREVRALVRVPRQEAPVEFVVDLAGLQRFLDSAEGSARDVFPDVDPIEGGLRLVSVHLWAEIGSAEARVLAVGVDRRGETWRHTEPAPPSTTLPPGDYRWTAEREGFDPP